MSRACQGLETNAITSKVILANSHPGVDNKLTLCDTRSVTRGTHTSAQPTAAPHLLAAFMAKHNAEPKIYDSHRAKITNPDMVDVDDVFVAFFSTTPAWVGALMRIRNSLVGRFGFEVGERESSSVPEHPTVGDRIGVFTVVARTDSEILLAVQDKHFDMRLSIALDPGAEFLALTTAAYPQDKMGHVYLSAIKPAHNLIAAKMAERCARR